MALSIIISVSYAQPSHTNSYLIKGVTSEKATGITYINHYSKSAKKSVKDSAKIEDGKFTLKLNIEEPVLASLRINKNIYLLFIEQNDMNLTISSEGVRLKGSFSQNQQDSLDLVKQKWRRNIRIYCLCIVLKKTK